MTALSVPAATPRVQNPRFLLIPAAGGILAALAMLGVYLGILTVLQSAAHALEQLTSDGLWVGLVAIGFGVQIGLYTYLRLIINAAKAAGATAMAGTGTGTSTLGMLACCAHHLTDVAPLVGLTGAGGLSGVIGFFTEWKYAFIALGLVMNLIGIVVTVRTIRKHKTHLDAMFAAAPDRPVTPSCH